MGGITGMVRGTMGRDCMGWGDMEMVGMEKGCIEVEAWMGEGHNSFKRRVLSICVSDHFLTLPKC